MNLINPYCSLADVQAEAQNIDSGDEPTLVNAINNASRWIEWYCHRDFLFHDYSDTTKAALVCPDDWVMQNLIFLPWPVRSIALIQVMDYLGNLMPLNVTDYRADTPYLTPDGVIRKMGRWLAGDQYVRGGLVPGRLYPLKMQVSLWGTFGYAPATKPGTAQSGATASSGTDVVALASHGMVDKQPVIFVSGTGFAGLTAGQTYYVKYLSTSTFSLALTAGGALIDITSDGSAGVFQPIIIDATQPSPDLPGEIRTATAVLASVRSGKAHKEVIDFSGNRVSVTQKQVPKDTLASIEKYKRVIL